MSDKSKESHINMIARNCIVGRLRRINRVVTSVYDRALRPLGLKASQLDILVCTAKFGLARRAQVCTYLMLESSTLSRNIDRMRRRGWLEVLPGTDARTASFQLTPLGQRLLKRAFPVWEKAQREALELLGSDATKCIALVANRLRPATGS